MFSLDDTSHGGGTIAPARSGTLLIYAPVPLYAAADGTLLLEDQACNGLRLWTDHFEKLIVIMPLETGDAPSNWVPLSRVGPALKRIEIHIVPTAYRPDRFLRHLRRVRRQIHNLIERSDYLSFSIGGLFGDWGTVASLEAHRMHRPFAVWTDRVESEVVRRGARSGSWKNRLRSRLLHRPMAMMERHIIRRAAIGLFHGRETYEKYAPFCAVPRIVHNIHLSKSDHIGAASLAFKLASVKSGPLRICYVGRAESMKGPHDWIEVIERVAAAGFEVEATWLGEGTELAAMRARAQASPAAASLSLPGFAADRTAVLEAMRASHIFLFCHKTPESPRCLIEALASGTPITGYEGAFARDLIEVHQGGLLTPLDDVDALANAVISLAADREHCARLIERAAADGAPFNDVDVFEHRSSVIKADLSFGVPDRTGEQEHV